MSDYTRLKTCKMCEQTELINELTGNCASCEYDGTNREDGDRMCPNCDTLNLIEHGLTEWKCLKCHKVYDEEWLDEGIEIDD